MDQRWPVPKTLSASHEYNGLHITWIDPEINGTRRSERLIIYTTVSCGVGSCECTTYGDLHGKLFNRDASKLSLELTGERHRFLQKSRMLWVAQFEIRIPLGTTVSVCSVASIQPTRLIRSTVCKGAKVRGDYKVISVAG